MTLYKKILCAFPLALLAIHALAQSNGESGSSPNTNSPYTRYGWGLLSNQTMGNNTAMGGIAYGLRNGAQINTANPASYTAIDSLTFLFDGGFSFQNTNLGDGNAKINAKNTSFDYMAMQFRLHKGLGMTIGILPFSSVGYNISTESSMQSPTHTSLNAYHTYAGNGGLTQIFLGMGIKIIDNLSVGFNASYLFGSVTQATQVSFSDASFDLSYKENHVKVKDYKLDFGIQYTQALNLQNSLTIGAVYSLKHKLNNESYTAIQGIATQTGYSFDLPHSFGAGISYCRNNQLTVGFDYSLQKWEDARYFSKTRQLNDRSKYAVGVEYIPNPFKRNYFSRIKYRAGAYYSNSYAKMADGNSADEFGVSAGFGLPVFQNKSILNVSAQYIKVKPQAKTYMLEENYLRLCIGLTFNERWFAKWRVE